MNKEAIFNKLKELVEFYKEKEDIVGIYLTSYLEDSYKILELNLLSENLKFSKETALSIDFDDNFRITKSLVTSKDLELKEENERNLVKLANSEVIYDASNKLNEYKKKITKIMDNEPLVSMYNEITFYDYPEITNGISK